MVTQPDETEPMIVLVHGAWADAGGFDRQIRALRQRGLRAIAFANPLRGLPGDATYLASLLQSLTGPVVLVGHSYGGAVISNAATGNEQVKALVYVNGWVPDEGESLIELAQLNEGSLIPDSLRPSTRHAPRHPLWPDTPCRRTLRRAIYCMSHIRMKESS